MTGYIYVINILYLGHTKLHINRIKKEEEMAKYGNQISVSELIPSPSKFSDTQTEMTSLYTSLNQTTVTTQLNSPSSRSIKNSSSKNLAARKNWQKVRRQSQISIDIEDKNNNNLAAPRKTSINSMTNTNNLKEPTSRLSRNRWSAALSPILASHNSSLKKSDKSSTNDPANQPRRMTFDQLVDAVRANRESLQSNLNQNFQNNGRQSFEIKIETSATATDKEEIREKGIISENDSGSSAPFISMLFGFLFFIAIILVSALEAF